MTITIKTISATTRFQKESGDKYIYSIDTKTKRAKTAVLVANIFGEGQWNIILITKNGERVNLILMKLSKKNPGQESGIFFIALFLLRFSFL